MTTRTNTGKPDVPVPWNLVSASRHSVHRTDLIPSTPKEAVAAQSQASVELARKELNDLLPLPELIFPVGRIVARFARISSSPRGFAQTGRLTAA